MTLLLAAWLIGGLLACAVALGLLRVARDWRDRRLLLTVVEMKRRAWGQ